MSSFNTLNKKALACVVSAALISWLIVVIFFTAFQRGKSNEGPEDYLVTARNFLKSSLETTFRRMNAELNIQAASPTIKTALREFEEAAYLIDSDISSAAATLRRLYVEENPHPEDDRSLLNRSSAKLQYDDTHRQHHQFFKQLSKALFLSDLVLVEGEGGYVLYSVNKKGYFGESVFGDKLKGNPMAQAARAGMELSEGETFFSGALSSTGETYVSAPVVVDGEVVGAMVFSIPGAIIKKLADPIRHPKIDAGLWMIDSTGVSISFAETASISVTPELTRKAIEGNAGVIRYSAGDTDFVAAFTPMALAGQEFTLIASARNISESAGDSEIYSGLLITLLLSLAVAFAISLLYTQRLKDVLEKISATVRSLAQTGSTGKLLVNHGESDLEGALLEQLNDVENRITRTVEDYNSKIEALHKYTESLESSASQKDKVAYEWKESVEKSEETAGELSSKVKLQRNEVAQLKASLQKSAKRLEVAEGEKRRFVVEVWPRVKEKLDSAIKTARQSKLSGLERTLYELDQKLDLECSTLAGMKKPDPASFKPVDLVDLAAEVVNYFKENAIKKNITLELINDTRKSKTMGDKSSLGAAMACLVDNALLFTEKDGNVTVKLRESGSNIRFEVRDTGTGITPEEIEKVFDRFYQGADSKRTHPDGLGLGLFAMTEVVTAHDGANGVESNPGKGSLFYFELPQIDETVQRKLPGI